MAQLVAHLLCKQRVPGSNPGSSTKKMSNATIKKTTRLLLLGVVTKKRNRPCAAFEHLFEAWR